MRLAFRLSYLGTYFSGSQLQPDLRTVEGEFIVACRELGLFFDWRAAGFLTSGRTDKWVHSRGQVVAFSTELADRAVAALNHQLPDDCWCTAWAEVPAEFHPRYDARNRTYRYFFPRPPGNREAMEQACGFFRGSHNFTNFARVEDRNPWRTILDISVRTSEEYGWLEVTAESFLWNQVRRMATVIAEVGNGEREPESVRELLEQETMAQPAPAPAEGLVLWDVDCGIAWQPLPPVPRTLHRLAELQDYHIRMGTICRLLGPDNQE